MRSSGVAPSEFRIARRLPSEISAASILSLDRDAVCERLDESEHRSVVALSDSFGWRVVIEQPVWGKQPEREFRLLDDCGRLISDVCQLKQSLPCHGLGCATATIPTGDGSRRRADDAPDVTLSKPCGVLKLPYPFSDSCRQGVDPLGMLSASLDVLCFVVLLTGTIASETAQSPPRSPSRPNVWNVLGVWKCALFELRWSESEDCAPISVRLP